jgi:hypothetical protein
MAVRATESRLPTGLNAAALGQFVASADGRTQLVSVHASPLQAEPGKLALRNTYVVFVTGGAAPASYAWTVEAFGPGAGDPLIHTVTATTEHGVLVLDSDEIDELATASIARVRISVAPSGAAAPLVMEQVVTALNGDIEVLIANGDEAPVALGGDHDASRAVANLYAPLITELTPRDSVIPAHLLAAVMYLREMKTSPRRAARASERWEEYLDDAGAREGDVPDDPVGPCGLRPYVVSMLYPADVWLSPPVKEKDVLISIGFERRLRETFHGLDRDAKIDLYNRLRFPRTAIPILREVLDGLRRLVPAWAALTKVTFLDDRACIQGIVSELDLGPQEDTDNRTRLGRRAYDLMFTPYIETMLAASLIQYQVIKILVLDARSGVPVPDLAVRKILLRSNDAVAGHDVEFVYQGKATNAAHSIAKQSQFALEYLGYDVGVPGNNYGDTGRQRYKEYWDHRIPDGPDVVDAIPAGQQPPEYMLRLIIAEYNSHRATDAQGVLNVRVPVALLNGRRISIDVGFWEAPIVLEALRGDDQSIRRPVAGGAPGSADAFTIAKDGVQNADWNANLTTTAHLGWVVRGEEDVESHFKVGLRLPIKTDSEPFDPAASALDAHLFSRYLDDDGFHFVLFAMTWCQPVWDDLTEPAPSPNAPAISHDAYVQLAGVSHMHMHLVTLYRDMGGSADYGGKGLGKCENSNTPQWRGDNGHKGLDIHARQGDDIYAVHGGRVDNDNVGDARGNFVTLDWPGAAGTNTSIQYLHLSAFSLPDSTNAQVTCVVAGTKVGAAGRTGNLGQISEWPGHVHLNMGTVAGEPYRLTLRETPPDDRNRQCLPHNDIPLAFPCHCQVTDPNTDPAGCDFNRAAVVNACWAVAELRCPYMLTGNAAMRLQAQLRYLTEQRAADGYFHPGTLDGATGDVPGNVAVNLPSGTAVTRTGSTRHDGRLIQIKEGTRTGWVEASLVDDDDRLVIPGEVKLGSFADAPVGATRMAIYVFRMVNGLLDYDDYASNFDLAAGGAAAALDNLAPILAPS